MTYFKFEAVSDLEYCNMCEQLVTLKAWFWFSAIADTELSLCRARLSSSASKLLRLKPIWYALLLEEVGWTERGQDGGYHWLLKWLPLHFCKKHDCILFFFFLFRSIIYPLHICLLHNILYPHSTDTTCQCFYRLLLMISIINCFFLSSHTLSQKAFMFSAAVFMLRKCNFSFSFLSFVCVVITKTTLELHARYYMSLLKPGVTSYSHCRTRGDVRMLSARAGIPSEHLSHSLRVIVSCAISRMLLQNALQTLWSKQT